MHLLRTDLSHFDLQESRLQRYPTAHIVWSLTSDVCILNKLGRDVVSEPGAPLTAARI
jgi:hypothetical protein